MEHRLQRSGKNSIDVNGDRPRQRRAVKRDPQLTMKNVAFSTCTYVCVCVCGRLKRGSLIIL